MHVPHFTFRAGDLLAVHTTSTLGRTIQRYQRKRYGATLGAQVNHIAVVAVPRGRKNLYPGTIVEAYWPKVRTLRFPAWCETWVNEARGEWALCLRPAGLNGGAAIARAALDCIGQPYDLRTLLRLGRIYRWWHPCRWWAELLMAHYRRDAGSLTCSELAARASAVVMDLPWPHLDLVSPAEIVDSGLWDIVWSSTPKESIGAVHSS